MSSFALPVERDSFQVKSEAELATEQKAPAEEVPSA
jgi:hypothetical protein